MFAEQKPTRAFVNYAHRGASAYAPENTLLSFYTGLYMRSGGMETDVRRTKDGILVLYHDATLERMTGEPGCVQDYPLAELRDFRVMKNGLWDRIATLEEFLSCFSFMNLQFAVELKQPGIEKEVVDLLNRYHMCEKTCITAFHLDYLQQVIRYAPQYATGYLTRAIDDALTKKLVSMGIAQACPQACAVTPALVSKLHDAGLYVRAWGIKDEREMRRVYDCGIDGMTVDYPDRLEAYIRQAGKRKGKA